MLKECHSARCCCQIADDYKLVNYYFQLYLVSAQIIATTGSSKPEYLADKHLKGGKAILKTCLEISKERLYFSDDYNTLWGSSRESMFDRFGLVQETALLSGG